MSRFYATIQGNAGEASRRGTKSSGIEAHVRGWSVGYKVSCYVDKEGHDFCEVWLTGGSNDPRGSVRVATVRSATANP